MQSVRYPKIANRLCLAGTNHGAPVFRAFAMDNRDAGFFTRTQSFGDFVYNAFVRKNRDNRKERMAHRGDNLKSEAVIDDEIRERAILVGVSLPGAQWPLESSLAELERLADTAGADTICTVTQKLDAPNPRTFIGSGKAAEIAAMVDANDADIVIFDDELTPSQQSNLERCLGKSVKVIDRTALILDIFALHATSKEGRLQVRLAQSQYLLPRLRGMWAHLASNKMGGGVGSRFGEGESQLEVDRRIVRKRITSIKRELEHLDRIRETQRVSRVESGVYKVALAGYTNAGKSCLLNRLTDAEVLSYDKLFATLDSTTRKLALPDGLQCTLTDTVGFIQKLPTTLIDAFRSTLREIYDADVVLHVIDASSPERETQMAAVEETLAQIGAKDIPRINVFNKIDLLDGNQLEALIAQQTELWMEPKADADALLSDELFVEAQEKNRPCEFVSALTGRNIETLIERLRDTVPTTDVRMDVVIPFADGARVSSAHELCRIISEEYTEAGTHLVMLAPKARRELFAKYEIATQPEE